MNSLNEYQDIEYIHNNMCRVSDSEVSLSNFADLGYIGCEGFVYHVKIIKKSIKYERFWENSQYFVYAEELAGKKQFIEIALQFSPELFTSYRSLERRVKAYHSRYINCYK